MIYGLIGRKLKHSYSMEIHNLLGNKDYILKEIEPEDLDRFFIKKDFKGINVTIPYKEKVMKYCKLSPQAKKIGAVNTIVNKEGVLYGYNTDYFGFLELCNRKGIGFRGQKVIILGSGGTSKTVKAVALDNGAKEVLILSRNEEGFYEKLEDAWNGDIVVNTTPVGMYPNNEASPINLEKFKDLKAVVDVIYNPLKTDLVLQRKDIITTGGLGMLLAQALYAHNLFFCDDDTSHKVSNYKLDQALLNLEKKITNYVLIGMPGVGKTTVGRMLARELGIKFMDTDKEILKVHGKNPKEIIEIEGEKRFREIEAEIITKISKETGQVIATGGGSILLKQNRKALSQNGKIIFLDKPINMLSSRGRPLSRDLEKLSKERRPIYEALQDYTVKNPRNSREATNEIIEALKLK